MKTRRLLFMLVFEAALGLLIALALMNVEPLASPVHFNPANRRLEWIQQRQAEVPAYLSIPAGLFTFGLVTLGLASLAPQRVRGMGQRLPATFKGWLQLGLLGLAGSATAAFLTACAVVGAATFVFAPLIASAYLLVCTFGCVPLTLHLGRRLLNGAGFNGASPLLEMLAGALVIYALTAIPLVGFLTLLLYSSLGLGLAVTTRFGTGHRWSLSTLTQEEIE